MDSIEKHISDIIHIKSGEIVEFVKTKNIDAIVNAASPTLMGSDSSGVDNSIHKAIDDSGVHATKKYKDLIKEELDGGQNLDDDIVRCRRGEAVVTQGSPLCRYVINVVGSRFESGRDKNSKSSEYFCTSSCIHKLESCYYQIVKTIMERHDISTVAVPIVSSGNYGFPFDLAVKAALSALGNALLEWRMKDPELFNKSSINKIYVCIYDSDTGKQNEKYEQACSIWNSYSPIFADDKRVVAHNSGMAHCRYLCEILKHDGNRGYFALAKWFRFLLLIFRTPFLLIMLLKDWLGGCNWEKRRKIVERIVLIKLAIPIICIFLFTFQCGCFIDIWEKTPMIILLIITMYLMLDTITYLVSLIVLSDIERPSANVIRSMICLLVNYIEVSADMAVIYYLLGFGAVDVVEAINFGFMSEIAESVEIVTEMVMLYANNGIKFFFISLAFGYFASNLHQRKFLS